MWNYLLTPRCIRKLERPKKQESTLFRLLKRPLFLATLIGIGMMAVPPWTYADLFVSNQGANNILRYDERTGEFLSEFIPAGSGGLGTPDGLIFGPDGNLYVGSLLTDSILRYDGITGDPLPSAGNSGATFVPSGSGGLTFGVSGDLGAWLVFGPDGNLFVKSGGITAPPQSSSVLRFDGTTGEFIDVFVSPGSGGLHGPRALVFGPDGNLYVNSSDPGPGTVLRYDGTTGAFLDVFVPAGSNPFGESGSGYPRGLVFGPDGNLYVGTTAFQARHPSVLRYDGTTGAFMDAFVAEGSGGLFIPTGPLFGPDGNLYLRSTTQGFGTGAVLRYDGTTGAFIDQFVPYGSGGLASNKAFAFRNTDPTTLAYVAVSRLHITAASSAVSGTAFDITVTALDPFGNIDTTYQGTVTFTSSDTYPGLLPADYTFTSGDQGMHTFSGGVTFFTAGAQTLTAQDTTDSTLTGSATVSVVAAPASQLLIAAPANAVSGAPFDVTLAALDPYGNVDTNYGGTVTWTSSDPDSGVLLPADYTFQSTDNGMVTFPGGVTLITLGNQTLTAADTLSGISGNASVTVGP
jgi:sugar lactone lactonase YvrE